MKRSSNFALEEKKKLLDESYAKIGVLAAKYKLTPEEREDLRQEVYLTALKYIDTLRDVEKIDRWLGKITKNCFKGMVASKSKLYEKEVSLEFCIENGEEIFSDADYKDLYDYYAKAENRKLLKKVLKMLDPRIEKIFRYRYFEGYTFVEISKMLGINLNTVKTMHSRALKKLRKYIKKEEVL